MYMLLCTKRAVDGSLFQVKCLTTEQALDEDLSLGHISKDDEVSNKQLKEIKELIAEMERETDPLVIKELEEEYKQKNHIKVMILKGKIPSMLLERP